MTKNNVDTTEFPASIKRRVSFHLFQGVLLNLRIFENKHFEKTHKKKEITNITLTLLLFIKKELYSQNASVKAIFMSVKLDNTLFTKSSARAGYDTRSIFKRSLTGWNSDLSFS